MDFRNEFSPFFLQTATTIVPSPGPGVPQELRARLPRLQELAELREARRLLRQLGGAEALKLGSWGVGGFVGLTLDEISRVTESWIVMGSWGFHPFLRKIWKIHPNFRFFN